jgi:hypothetical protein
VIVGVANADPALYVTEQLPLDSVQVVLANDEPDAPPVWLNVIVPAGVEEPAPDVSLTVAVHELVPPTGAGFGEQPTLVLEFRLLTAMAKVPLLVR